MMQHYTQLLSKMPKTTQLTHPFFHKAVYTCSRGNIQSECIPHCLGFMMLVCYWVQRTSKANPTYTIKNLKRLHTHACTCIYMITKLCVTPEKNVQPCTAVVSGLFAVISRVHVYSTTSPWSQGIVWAPEH